MAAPIPSVTGGASGPAMSGDSRNGSTIFTNGGLTVNRNNPWMMFAVIAVVVVLVLLFLTRKKSKTGFYSAFP